MAGVWALENALLMGCYAFGAGVTAAAAATTTRTFAQANNASPATDASVSPPPPSIQPSPMADGESSPLVASIAPRRTRRGKPSQRQRLGAAASEEASPHDEVLSTSVASSATNPASTVHSDGSFRSCLSSTTALHHSSRSNHGSAGGRRMPTGLSSASLAALEDVLPRCIDDLECGLLNDPSHYARFKHTCRLVSCPSRHRPEHCAYFDHPGAAPAPLPLTSGTGTALSVDPHRPALVPAAIATSHASPVLDGFGAASTPSSSYSPPSGSAAVATSSARLTGVSLAAGRSAAGIPWSDGSDSASASPHAHIFHDAVTATPVMIQWEAALLTNAGPGDDAGVAVKSAMVCGDWRRVSVHTFKQHLRQITGIPPATQLLRASLPGRLPPQQRAQLQMGRGRGLGSPSCRPAAAPPQVPLEVFMTDDFATVASYLDYGAVALGADDTAQAPPVIIIGRDEGRLLLSIPSSPPPAAPARAATTGDSNRRVARRRK